MHTVELYELAVHAAATLGYEVRQENLGGVGGGACEVGRRKFIFVDLTLSPLEQLDQVVQALSQDPGAYGANISGAVRDLIAGRRAA